MDIQKYNVIIFDCDGVIYNTNTLKLEAFKSILSSFGDDNVHEFLKYFRFNFGRSRYVHIRYFIEDILKISFDEKLYEQLVLSYGSRCKLLYTEAELCIGVMDLLENLKNVAKYVASGSDQNELRKVFKSNFLDCYFEGIYGSPQTKNNLVKEICSRYEDRNILMIGDAHADYVAAKCSQIDFLYVERYSVEKLNMKTLSIKENFQSVSDLSNITW